MEDPFPSTCVISRIYIGEIPYIKAFINHYLRLKFDKIYLIITKKEDESRIRTCLKEYDNIEYMYPLNDGDVKMLYMNHLIQFIKEDYVLHVDIDEFLDLGVGNTIKMLFKTVSYDKYHFTWAIVVNDGLTATDSASLGQTHRNKPWKTMCKTSIIEEWVGAIDVKTKSGVDGHHSKYNLIHYWGRSYNDLLIKSIYGNGFKDAKCCSLDNIIKYVDDVNVNSIPNRLKMMAVLSRCHKTIRLNNDYCLKYIELDKEEALLTDVITMDQRERMFKKYTEFKNRLDYTTHIEPYFSKGLLGIEWDDVVV
jgi:hypothetical protein